MNDDKTGNNDLDWLDAELADTVDEDFELELSEPALSSAMRKVYSKHRAPTMERRDYFHALLSL